MERKTKESETCIINLKARSISFLKSQSLLAIREDSKRVHMIAATFIARKLEYSSILFRLFRHISSFSALQSWATSGSS